MTHLALPDGSPLYNPTMINKHGEVPAIELEERELGEPNPGEWTALLTVLWRDGTARRIDISDEFPVDGHSLRAHFPAEISNRGHVVGNVMTTGPAIGPFLWQDDQFTLLGGLSILTVAGSVNDHGQALWMDLTFGGHSRVTVRDAGENLPPPSSFDVVHRSSRMPQINNRSQVAFDTDQDGNQRATIWEVGSGEAYELGTLGGDTSRFAAVNDRGMVAGTSTTTDGDDHAFLWHNGHMTDLGTLGGDTSQAIALNEWGQVVGTSTTADGDEHAFLWHNGYMTDLGVTLGYAPPSLESSALGIPTTGAAINNWGQVVGTRETSEGTYQAFLWQNGRTADLGALVDAEEGSAAADINDRGQIVGQIGAPIGLDEDDMNKGFEDLARPGVLWEVSPLWGYLDDS